jgi:hypothetical protein
MVSLLLTMAISIPVGIGRQHPSQSYIPMLHLTDCELPAWIGILPGSRMTIEEAYERIVKAYGKDYEIRDDVSELSIVNKRNEFEIFVQYDVGYIVPTESSLIVAIWLWPRVSKYATTPDIALADLHEILGYPVGVFHSDKDSIASYLFYLDGQVEVATAHSACGRISFDQSVIYLVLSSQTFPQDLPPPLVHYWLGFGTCYDTRA